MGRIVKILMAGSVALLLSTSATAQTTEKAAPEAAPAEKAPATDDKKTPATDDKKAPATDEKKDASAPPKTPAPPKTATEGAPAESATPKPAAVEKAPSEAEKAPAEEAPSEKDIAANFYREAQKLFAQELYLAALSAYKKSYKFYKTPVTLYNMAKCHEKLGDSKNCIDGYEAYIKDYKDAKGTMPPDIGDIKNAIAKCRLGLRLVVTIESDPPGAAVYIDDPQKMVGQTPMKTAVDPGTYTLFVRAKGRVELKRQMIVQQGEPLKLFFKLEELTRAGTVRIDCNIAGASIFHNGKNIGRTPLRAELVINEGKHQFAIEKDEYRGHNQTLEVKADGKYIVEADLFLKDPPPTWKGPIGWSSLIIGAILIGGGYGSGYYADTLFQKTDDFKLYSMLQQVGYGAGGGLAGIGLVLIIWEAAGGNVIKEKDAISALDGSKSYSLQPFVRVGAQGGILGADFRF